MKNADVIIGANFGDEGKGLVTDFCASRFNDDAVVVRFNGGAQAGHTVTTPDGRRHVFSHFASGSFAGAETFLSKFFVCHPMLFRKEHAILAALGVIPRVRADSRAFVTTPYDMMINQIAEESRGTARHGSCGMGFGETIERAEKSPYTLTCADLTSPDITSHLRAIRDLWVPYRLQQLGITHVSPRWQDRLKSDAIIDAWLEDVAFFLSATRVVAVDALAHVRHGLIFEGAQGLLLDQHRGYFPHVTRSNTGIRNVIDLAREADIAALHVHYITRAYLTRHGAGPLSGELPAAPYPDIHDPTNITNDWQGALRFALLDADLLQRTIRADLVDAKDSPIDLTTTLAMTCLDQVGDECRMMVEGKACSFAPDAAADFMRQHTGCDALLTARGPTRKTIERH